MEVLGLAATLKKNELLMGELYAECQKLFPQHEQAFRLLELEEKGHAFLLDEIIENCKSCPQNWKMGKMSRVTAELISIKLAEAIEEIRSGKASPKYAITFAISTELSLSEKDYGRALIPTDEKFLVSLKKLAEGFADHYKKLQELEKSILQTGKTGFDNLNKV